MRNIIKILKQIEIVRSDTYGISSLSQKSANAILIVLKKHYSRVCITSINNQADLSLLGSRKPDLVFLGIKHLPVTLSSTGFPYRKVWVSTFLTNHDIAHTGSLQAAIELDHSKALAKQRVIDCGLSSAPYFLYTGTYADEITAQNIGYPLFVKPMDLGAGQGIDTDSFVSSYIELKTKAEDLTNTYSTKILVEKYLSGREFSVAILKDENSHQLSALPIEITAPDKMALTQELKSSNQEIVTSVKNPIIRAKLIVHAIDIFKALGGRDYGRIDIRMDAQGEPNFIEANLIPSLIDNYGSYPKACFINLGISHEEMILRIVRLAFARTDSDDLELPVLASAIQPIAG